MNYYSKAIDILAECRDEKRLLNEIAKIAPGTLFRAWQHLQDNPDSRFYTVRKIIREDPHRNKIPAIKEYRNIVKSAGLKEAKDAVEKIYEEMGL
jgi:ribosomal protein L7/L12